jgi:uncharacterized protein (TIGR04255 family)
MSPDQIPALSRLPSRITPCPIVNAVIEVHFQTDVQPTVVPGLVYGAVRERFPQRAEFPEGEMPDILRVANPILRYRATAAFSGPKLSLLIGPRAFALAMAGTDYPGWAEYRDALVWVLAKMQPLGVVKIPERLALRYADFFSAPIKERLQVDLLIGGQSQATEPFQFTCQLRREGFQCIVQASSNALLQNPKGVRPGCALDVDVGFGVEPDKFWGVAVTEFERAHKIQKELFFRELLQPSFLATLSPEYD